MPITAIVCAPFGARWRAAVAAVAAVRGAGTIRNQIEDRILYATLDNPPVNLVGPEIGRDLVSLVKFPTGHEDAYLLIFYHWTADMGLLEGTTPYWTALFGRPMARQAVACAFDLDGLALPARLASLPGDGMSDVALARPLEHSGRATFRIGPSPTRPRCDQASTATRPA